MKNLLLVGGGGFAGAILRYFISGVVLQQTAASRFPWGTLVVNVVGCLAIGAISGYAVAREALSAEARLFLMTGVLGGFTTFSAFGLETMALAREHSWGAAALNIVAHVVLGLAAVWAGYRFFVR